AFKIEKYEHTYPHCWRTDKPIIYYPLDAWFVRTTAVKERMIELNNAINWKPASTGTGRFGNWLENMVDWNLSRSRYWGTPLPIWRTGDGSEEKCIGSIDELNEEIKKAAVLGEEINKHYLHQGVLDLHKPFVDDIILISKDGRPMTRVPDLVDVWFDSGAMPYAQWHFPFENKETFKDNFPADFIAEGVDQTRGWFYTLHALGALLFDSRAFKTVVSNGLVLDKNGNKMSKRLGNAIDPFETLSIFGADATRWYLITNASPWDSLKFDIEGIKEVQRKFFGTVYNTYQFFVLYANVDRFAFSEAYIPIEERPEIDRWILSSLNSLKIKVQQTFDDYEPTQAGRAIENFVDQHLSNWYVRLCRRRFWKGEYEKDKICAYQTLYECLETLAGLIAPIAPFFADWLYNNLNSGTKKCHEVSVHHTYFPKVAKPAINKSLEERMELAQDISSLILSLRKKINIKVRQPLQKALIPAINNDHYQNIKAVESIIKAETNIKEIEILPHGNNFIRKKAKANFKTLGKVLGARMKWASEKIQSLGDDDLNRLQGGNFLLNPDYEATMEEPVYLSPLDVEIITDEIPGYEITSKGSLTVALDITLNPALEMEGVAREFVNRIQNIRKEKNLQLTDKIFVKVAENGSVQAAITHFNDYICAEILAEKVEFVPHIIDGNPVEVNDTTFLVNVIKKD
ncbi:MAG: class I tRNA ligase family protein, partial [Ginsengibacter sp.]